MSHDENYEEDYQTTCTNSGTPLNTLAYLTDLPLHDSRTAKVYWEKESNRFLLCPTDGWDFEIERTPQALRAFALMLAFDPKEWGCRRCGCTAEFRDGEYVCYCDTCAEGCDASDTLDPLPDAPPRQPSRFFASRCLPPPLHTGSLERQIAVAVSAYTPHKEMCLSPLSPIIEVIQHNDHGAVSFSLH
jgi:hypothetical protein